MTTITRVTTNSEWIASYEDGKLLDFGDAYWVDEKLFQHLGVYDRYSEQLISEDGVPAKTLHDLDVREEAWETAHATAKDLRLAAAEFIRQAEELEKNS